MNSLLSAGSILVSWRRILNLARLISPQASAILADLASGIIVREEPSERLVN
jgi:hypothetical protein